MATAFSLRGAPPAAPRARNSGRLVRVSPPQASLPRGGARVGRRSLSVSAAAADSSSLPPVTGAPAWDALGGVSVLAAGTGDAVPLTDLWDPTEVSPLPANYSVELEPITGGSAFVSYAEAFTRAGGGRGGAAEAFRVLLLVRRDRARCILTVSCSFVARDCSILGAVSNCRSWELASVLKDSMEKFDAAGAKLIAIGVGTPDKARILADRVSDLVLNFCARRECVRSQMNPAGS